MIKILKKHEGLGDTIEMITTATGIKYAVEMASKAVGKPCGCSERKEKVNKLVSYGSKK